MKAYKGFTKNWKNRRIKMGEMMTFPASVEEFMEQYKITDTEHVYSNGTEFVPIYRMKQWFEHANYNGGSGVRHGRWIDKPTGRYRQWQAWCSACDEKCGCGGTIESQHKMFCPNCGAKMDLED